MTTLIIGASRGIGFELGKNLLNKGKTVHLTCRSINDNLKELKEQFKDKVVVHENVKTDDESSIANFSKVINPTPPEAIVVVAGVLKKETLDDFNVENIEFQFKVNSVGPLLVGKYLATAMSKGGKFIALTSRMGSIADNGSGGMYGYRMSKAALNAGLKSLSIDLKEKEISVTALHPGYVITDMTGGKGNISAKDCAEQISQRIDEANISNTGEFWHANGEKLPW